MLVHESFLPTEDFNAIHSQIFKENNEQHEVKSSLIKKSPILYDSRGNKIKIDTKTGEITDYSSGDGLSRQLDSWFQA